MTLARRFRLSAGGKGLKLEASHRHLSLISAPPALLPASALIRQQSQIGRLIKRSGDVAFSLAVLSLGMPVFLLVALLVKLSSPGPVFYIQRRVGRGYKRFGCIKFRTSRMALG